MFCPINLHEVLHGFIELLLVLRELHVDEVDHNDASDVAEPQLPCNLFCSLHIGLKGVFFLVVADTLVAAVDIDHMQCLCMLNDQVGSGRKVDCFSKSTLHLFGDASMVKNRG